MPDANPNVNWDELPPDDVLEALQQNAQANAGQACTGLLDTHQWLPLASTPGLLVSGGHPDAQFRRIALGVESVLLQYSNFAKSSLPENARSARGLRTYLEHLGVPVSALGDIAAGEDLHVCHLPGVLAGYPELQLLQVASWSPPMVKQLKFTIAANRLDALVSSAFKVGRAEAQVAIKHGFVFLNFCQATKRTHNIKPGNQVVFRTKGRVEILTLETNRRSGRLMVEIASFPA